ncbi:DciA family protein [Oryzisolibacter sp. LB2S]|uniref:DciA family protein n=1 Tax=Alicycliphilus soli TaxID=3228789 RepID=UPI00345A0CB3
MNRRHYAIPLQQASQESPTLARLTALTRDSSDRLKAIESLIPPMLRPAVQAGPIDGGSWCLLVSSNAAAAKLRQLLPAFQAHLRRRGWEVDSIRLKIQS